MKNAYLLFLSYCKQKWILGTFICIFLSGFLGLKAQITSAMTGNWNNTSTWVGGIVPISTDNVIIANGHTVTVNTAGTINNVTINGQLLFNSTITFTISGTITNSGFFKTQTNNPTITCGGAVTNNSGGTFEIISGNPTINFNSTITNLGLFTVTAGAPTFNFAGNITNNSGGTFTLVQNTSYNFTNDLTITPSNAMTFGAGTGGGTISAGMNVIVANGIYPVAMMGSTALNISGTLTNNLQNNTLTVQNMSGTGTFINGTNATFRHGANAAPTVTNFNCTAVGNLVLYDSSSSQSVRSTIYHHLTFGNLATKTLGGHTQVNGTFFVGTSTTANLSGFILTALGDVTINGSVSAGSSTLLMQGGTNTTLSLASATTLYNLTINKSSSTAIVEISNSANLTVGNTLTLTNGKLQINLGNLILSNATPATQISPATPTANSYIITNGTGVLQRNGLAISTEYFFPVGTNTTPKMVSVTPSNTGNTSVRFDAFASLPPQGYNTSGGTWEIQGLSTSTTVKFYSPVPTLTNNSFIYINNTGWTQQTTNRNLQNCDMPFLDITTNKSLGIFSTLFSPASKSASNNTATSFTANWNVSGGADRYFLDVSTDKNFGAGSFVGAYNDFPINGGGTTSQVITGLTPNTVYFYRLRAKEDAANYTSIDLAISDKMTSTYIGVGAGNNANVSGGTITYPSGSALDNISFGLTLEMWIKTPTISGTIMSKKNGTVSGWQLDYDASNKNFTFTTYNSGTTSISTPNNSALPNTLMHLTCAYLTNSSTLLINGEYSASGSTPATLGNTNSLIISPPTGTGLDELRIWGTLVAQSETREYLCKKMNGSHPNIANLLVYMPFDEGTQITTTKYIENKAPNANVDATYTTGVSAVVSNAPIGDASVSGISSTSITLNDVTPFTDAFILSNITGSPANHHIYKVKAQPNVLTPPVNYLGMYNGAYYGVFFVGGTNPQGTISYSYNNNPNIANGNALRFARRDDACDLTWKRYGGIINRQDKTVNRMRATTGEYILATRNGIMSNARNAGTGLAITPTQQAIIARPVQNDFTIEFWVNPTSNGTGSGFRDTKHIITSATGATLNTSNFVVGLNSSNQIVFGIGNGSSDVFVASSTVLALNQWYHVTVTRGQSTKSMEIFVNGKSVGINANNSNTAVLNADASIQIGRTTPLPLFDGIVDEIKFWDTVVSSNTIKDWMNLRANSDHPNFNNLVAYYRCDDATDTFAEDLANGQEANLSNNTMWVIGTQPLGDGAAVRLPATSGDGSTYTNFTAAGCSIIFPSGGPYPNGDLVVTRLDTAPESYPNVPGMSFISSYWIIRNYGTNLTFKPLTEIKFEVPAGNTISALDLSTPNNVKLYKRPDNAVGSGTWNFVQGATGFGSVRFGGPTSIGDFSQFVVGSLTSTLGVSWVNFEGQRTTQNEVTLRWNTATESKNIGFEVQRSEDGVNFVKIGFVDGAGTTAQNKTYTFTDKESTQSYYYRLRQVDVDGDANFSKVLYINADTQDEVLKIYPNPTKSEIHLQTKTAWATNDQLKITIINAEGKKMWEGKGNLLDLQENINLQLRTWKTGMYILKLATPTKILESKFVKQ